MKSLSVAALVAVSFGCGSGSSAHGTVQGVGLSVQGGSLASETYNWVGPVHVVNVYLADMSKLCGGSTEMQNFTALTLSVADASPITARTYQVASSTVDPLASPSGGFAIFDKKSSCQSAMGGGANATGGSITFTDVSDAHASGQFSLVFGEDTLTGSFDVDSCGGWNILTPSLSCG